MLTKKIVLVSLFLFAFILSMFSQKLDTVKLFFDINESLISNANQTKLKELIENKNIEKLYIYAYTDFLGSVEFNNNLSNNRSNNTKQFIVSLGFRVAKIIECEGKGVHKNSLETNRTDNNDRGISEHRKVEILYFLYKDSEKAVSEETNNIDSEEIEEAVAIPIFADLSEEKLEVGENIVIDNILFVGGTPNFKPQSENALRQLYLAMKNNPTLIIEIQGHICCQNDGEDGWDIINQNNYLSENRAEAVYNYLVEAGISGDRMTYVGFGSSQRRFPEERNAREEDLNRRVEIFIVDK